MIGKPKFCDSLIRSNLCNILIIGKQKFNSLIHSNHEFLAILLNENQFLIFPTMFLAHATNFFP